MDVNIFGAQVHYTCQNVRSNMLSTAVSLPLPDTGSILYSTKIWGNVGTIGTRS